MGFLSKMVFVALTLMAFSGRGEVICSVERWQSQNTVGLTFLNYNNRAVRAGYIAENRQVPFRGNIVYLQGLADSMRNHLPLFNALTDQGYRVIAFDYFGQGGTPGSMNEVTVESITDLGAFVYRTFARDIDTAPVILLGWSTGGLAAYRGAKYGFNGKWPDAVVLITPGVVLPWVIGDTFRITLETLTKRPAGVYENTCDPHIDPISPQSPLQVPVFAKHLVLTAQSSHKWKINRIVKGLALISGPDDSYIKAQQTRQVIEMNAPHFEIVGYPRALHEIDNEIDPKPETVQRDILQFLSGVTK
jgi:alpha-beta hydrolase superfamily lysophospholipase